MKNSLILLAAFSLAISALGTQAETLKGSKVRADLFFLNDPTQTNLLTDTLDTVGSGKEFVYDDNVATYSINVNAGGFTIREVCDTGVTLKKCDNEPGFAVLLKDNLFVNAFITLDSDTLGVFGGVDPGNPKILLVIAPFDLLSRNERAVFSVVPAPEPSSLMLLGTGLAGLAFMGRLRFRS